MTKTNFTFARVLIVALLAFAGLNQANAQCFPPINHTVVNVGQDFVTLQWTSSQASVIEHCWNIEIGGSGFAVGNGTAIVAQTVCWNDPNLTIVGNTLTYTFTGLIPGTTHDWWVAETCDGLMPPFNNSGWSFGGTFATFDSPFGLDFQAFKPTCPEISPGYVPDGLFTVTVTDPTTCPGGTYDLVANPVPFSSPLGNTPPATLPPGYLGVPAGTYFFFFAGAGQYDVDVTEVGICNPINNPDDILVTVPDGMDMEAAVWTLTDVLGNTVADNDPLTPQGSSVTLADVTLPEGSCSYQQQLYLSGIDNCDGLINNPNAVTATAVGLPITTFPGTQVTVTPDNFGIYLIDINWATGISQVTVTGSDAAGNATDLQVTRFVDDNINPSVTIVGANNVTIPACEDSRDITVTVYIDDGCDQTILNGLLLGNLDVNFNGTEQLNALNPFDFGAYLEFIVTVTTADDGDVWSVTYTDVYGNVGFADVQLSVEQAAEDMPPMVIAADENVLVPVCDLDEFVFYSFQIFDDCANINTGNINFDDGGSGLAVTFVDIVGTQAFVEATGNVDPGNYFLTIEYQGTTVVPALSVSSQQDAAPLITMPGNLNFTIPVCQPSLTTTFSITISDDCDDVITEADTEFTLDGAVITPVFFNNFNEGQAYAEFEVTLSAANNGDFLTAEYTDGAGNTTFVDAQITVTAQPDNWAPIIVYPSQDIVVNLDPCDVEPAIIRFEVTATDNCDGNLVPNVTVNGAGFIPLPGGLGGSTYSGAYAPGTYSVVITATDAAGNTRTEDFTITVNQGPRPQDFLGCENSINVTLNDNCQSIIVPEMVLDGNFGCLVDDNFNIVIVDGNLNNGNIVDGCGNFLYEVTLAAPSDIVGFNDIFAPQNWSILEQVGGDVAFGGGNSFVNITGPEGPFCAGGAEASMAITVPIPGTISFDYDYQSMDSFGSGFDAFIALVDANGTVTVLVNTIASVSASGTITVDVEAGDVFVMGVASTDCIFGPGFVNVSNWLFEAESGVDANFTTCWGNINAEDKTKPEMDCPSNTDQAVTTEQVQFVTGTLATTDPSLVLVNYTCFLDAANPQGGIHYYDLHTFTVTQEDVFTFDMISNFANFDGAMLLYQGAFNPASPCENVIAQSDVGFIGGGGTLPFLGFNLANFPPPNNPPSSGNAFDPVYRIQLPLIPGQTYTLFVTTFGTADTGPYTFGVYSDGNGLIDTSPAAGVTPVPQTETAVRDLICDDLDQIRITNGSYIVDANGNIVSISTELNRKLGYTGFPTVSDNCGQVRVTVNDQVQTNGNCGDVIVTRTFTAADKVNSPCTGSPNTVVCQQIITVRRPTTSDVVVPPFTVFIECDEGFDTDANGNPHPSISGYPWLRTAFAFHDLDQVYCNLGASYSDEPRVVTCESSYKLRREWNIFDWCNPSSLIVFNQIIKVGDFTAPEVSCPTADYNWDGIPDLLTYPTGPFDCSGAFQVPMPSVTDNCSGWEVLTQIVTDIEVDVTNQYGQVIGTTTETIVVATILPNASRYVSGIPKGQHRFRYIVTDNCDNEATIECDFQVVDSVEPVAICDDQLNISIGGQGYARVYAEDLDEGSYDNCGEIKIEVRRFTNNIPGPWGPYVEFNCGDVQGMVRIELRVWDDANMNGVFGQWYGNPFPPVQDAVDNSNVCWLDVLVEDKIRPVCVAPHNVSVDCDDVPYNFDPFNTTQLQNLFGVASATDNCTGAQWEELTPIVQLEDCGYGRIIRRFRAIDAVGNVSTNSCQQIVTINEVHNYEIKFPRDAQANCGTPSPDTLTYSELACDLLAVNVHEDFFSASGDECYKIFRRYRVINWCEYDGDDDPIVVGRDEDCDGNPGDENVWVLVRPNGVTYYDRDNNENNTNPFAFTKSPSCDGLTNPTGHWINSTIDQNATPPRNIQSVGYWQYTQVIKVYDNVDPIITFDATDPFCSLDNVNCDAVVSVPFSIDENCTPDDLTIKIFLDAFADGILDGQLSNNSVLSGSYPDYAIGGEYPLGSHAFEVHVEDGCGNVNSIVIPFSVVDCKAPAPTCINGLAIELMPTEPGTDADGDGDEDTGAMAVWATDFIASPISDCSEPIKFSINRDGDTPSINQTGIVLTCDDPQTLIVEIYAWDSAFNPYAVQPDGTVGGPNYDHCETYILVQDNMFDVCTTGGTGSIAGVIATEDDEEVQGVSVTLSGDMNQSDLTGIDGAYGFDVAAGGDYTVTPLNDLNHKNGVSTFDLVLISKHILGVTPLNSPYKRIAADVDNSGNITVSDLIQLRRLILSITTTFPNNTSWRFIDAAYVFPQPNNPWYEQFPEVVNFNNVAEDALLNGDFVAVKIGDVSGDAQVNSFASIEDRTQGTFAFQAADVAVKAGNEYTVEFTGADMTDIQGYQLTLKLAGLELVDVVYGVATEENFGFRFIDEGMITMSWNGEAADADVLFSLVVKATTDANLSQLLSVSSRYTTAEAYTVGNDKLDVAIQFTGSTTTAVAAADKFELFQNTPNPFNGETKIGFNLPADMKAQITIADVSGRALKLVRGEFVKGYNEVIINSSELPAGVLYYTLESDNFTATKKMIIVE